VLALGSLVACAAREEPEPKFTPASRMTTPEERVPPEANLSQHERSLSALTNARCDREARCNNVGAGRKYENRAQCVAKLDDEGYSDLNEDNCPLGVDQDKLGACLVSLRDHECGPPLARIDDLRICADTRVCVH